MSSRYSGDRASRRTPQQPPDRLVAAEGVDAGEQHGGERAGEVRAVRRSQGVRSVACSPITPSSRQRAPGLQSDEPPVGGCSGQPRSRAARLAILASPMLAQRLTAQLLAGPPARDPVAVAERLLAVQGQDPRGARLAIRARSRAGSPPTTSTAR